jgi:hypothetical protein
MHFFIQSRPHPYRDQANTTIDVENTASFGMVISPEFWGHLNANSLPEDKCLH